MGSERTNRVYEFGPFRLDTEERTLRRDGQEVALTPKALDVLLELVRRNGKVVERDELMRLVWTDSFVEEGNLKVTIFMLRKAIEDNPSQPRYIQTAPRRGYRFLADVVEDMKPGIPAANQTLNSIAVLPFKLVGKVEEEYLGLGLADALIIKLSRLKNLVVRPTSAVRRYSQSEQDPIAVGEALDVDAILDGNIYRSGDRIRVTAQLIHAKNGSSLWGDKFDARFTDIFDVEDSISQVVAEALTRQITRDDRKQLTKRYTENLESYQLYLKGRYHWAKRVSQSTRLAVDNFRAAIDLDPNYTLAYAGLADCYTQLGWLRLLAPNDAYPLAKAAALRALDLDPELAEAHASLAWVQLLYDLDYVTAETTFKHALELNPNYSVSRMWYGVLLISMGRFEEALTEVRHAQRLDPLSPIINAVAGWPYYFMRRYDSAVDQYKKALEIEPNSLPGHYLLGCAYAQMGDGKKAVAAIERARALDNSSLTTCGLADAYVVDGREAEARDLLAQLNRMTTEGQYVSSYDLAGLYLRLEEKQQALKLLQEAIDEHSAWLIFLPVEPKFDDLRSDARFIGLLRRVAGYAKSL